MIFLGCPAFFSGTATIVKSGTKRLYSSSGGTYADAAAGVHILNLSLGRIGESAILQDAINYADNKGTVIVAAAGNAGSNFVLYPARYPNVIAVARTDNVNHWSNSNYGPEIDLSAPGISIYSTVPGRYGYKSGSSMSTGFVSGLDNRSEVEALNFRLLEYFKITLLIFVVLLMQY